MCLGACAGNMAQVAPEEKTSCEASLSHLEGPPIDCPGPLGAALPPARANRGHCRGRRNAVRWWEPFDHVPRGERGPGAGGKRALARHWTKVHFGSLQVETVDDHHVFQVQVYLNELVPEAVRVELYADAVGGEPAVRQMMARGRQLTGKVNGYMFSAQVSAARLATDYTPRIIPTHPDGTVPLEAAQIRWQR